MIVRAGEQLSDRAFPSHERAERQGAGGGATCVWFVLLLSPCTMGTGLKPTQTEGRDR
jgi:hypothetical protein